MDKYLKLHIAITIASLLFATIAVFETKLGIAVTPTVLGLLAIAAVPWFASLLQSAELLGGCKLEFRS